MGDIVPVSSRLNPVPLRKPPTNVDAPTNVTLPSPLNRAWPEPMSVLRVMEAVELPARTMLCSNLSGSDNTRCPVFGSNGPPAGSSTLTVVVFEPKTGTVNVAVIGENESILKKVRAEPKVAVGLIWLVKGPGKRASAVVSVAVPVNTTAHGRAGSGIPKHSLSCCCAFASSLVSFFYLAGDEPLLVGTWGLFLGIICSV
jgi:hypothetical protein